MAAQNTQMPGQAGTPPPSRAPMGPGRIIALIAGVLALLVALGLGAAGLAVALVSGARDSDGYLGTGTHRMSTPTAALVSDSFEIQIDPGPDWLYESDQLGTLRVSATGAEGSAVFVGVAAPGDVQDWLSGTAYDQVQNISLAPFRTDYVRRSGELEAVSTPGEEDFWVASSEGTGPQTVSWFPSDGRWVLVIANADGATGVDVGASAAARIPSLGWVAVGLFVGALVALVVAVVLIVIGVSRPSRPPQHPLPPRQATGPPAMTPPAGTPPPTTTPPAPPPATTR